MRIVEILVTLADLPFDENKSTSTQHQLETYLATIVKYLFSHQVSWYTKIHP